MDSMIAPIGSYPSASRSARVEPASPSDERRGDTPGQALVPAGPRRDHRQPESRPHEETRTAAQSCAAAGVWVQTDAAPRRGLRADSVERRRYQAAYGAAMNLAPAARPIRERCA
jgi:hypothetical protein